MPSAPDLLLHNADVITLDTARPRARAVALRDGRILSVGSAEELLELVGPRTRVEDLGGGTLIPGFVDAHSHLGFVADRDAFFVALDPPPVGATRTVDAVVQAFRARAGGTRPGEWLVGMGYDQTLLAERRHPMRRDLDRASAEHPILALHISGHLAVANTRALALAGITRDTPQPAGGRIRLDPATGEPDGVLEEPAAFGRIFPLLPQQPEKARLDALEAAARRYAACGITTAQDGATELRALRDLANAARAGRLPLRVVAWPTWAAWQKLEEGASLPEAPSERFRMGAVKFFADGSIQGYTGHLCQPYHVPQSPAEGEFRGYAATPREELAENVARVHAAGRQVAVHANGDAAIDDLLFAVEEAQRRSPRADARPVAVHAQMTREDQLDRMRELSVVPSFFVLHTYYWGDRHRDLFLGPERARRISPARSALARGIRFTLHTDAPVVPMDPLLLWWSAVNRVTTGGEVLGPEQRLTPLEALRALTLDAAYQVFEEHTRGSIEPGKLADLVLLSGNPLADPAALRELRVLRTWVGGEPVTA
jgi:hypothetical protein